MQGKVCLITGGTNGFGLLTAKELARKGAKVVIVGRNREKTDAVRLEIGRETENTPDMLIADLLYQAQVKRVAAEFKQKYDRLDILLNNAGYAYTPLELTSEGFERTFALNYMAYFTLTLELIDLLIASAPSRIINTSSEAHQWGEIELDNLQGEKGLPAGKFGLPMMYGWSNVDRIMFTYELAERLKSVGVTANSLNPGFVPIKRTEAPWFINMLAPIVTRLPFAIKPEAVAETMVYLASSLDAAGKTGLYYDKGEVARSIDQTYDVEVRKALWEKTLALAGYEDDPLEQALSSRH